MSVSATVITNAGPLMALGKLHRLQLLADLHPVVRMPTAVYDEVVHQGLARGQSDARSVRRFWRRQRWPIDEVSTDALASVETIARLGRGERAALALARQWSPALLLMDDATARAEARRLGLAVRGTLGVLVQAYRRNLIDFDEVEFLIEELAARADIWISPALCGRVLDELRRPKLE